jgi:hypothetical protein
MVPRSSRSRSLSSSRNSFSDRPAPSKLPSRLDKNAATVPCSTLLRSDFGRFDMASSLPFHVLSPVRHANTPVSAKLPFCLLRRVYLTTKPLGWQGVGGACFFVIPRSRRDEGSQSFKVAWDSSPIKGFGMTTNAVDPGSRSGMTTNKQHGDKNLKPQFLFHQNNGDPAGEHVAEGDENFIQEAAGVAQ